VIRYMLDTNICIHLIKYRPPSVLKKLSSIPIDEVGVSSIVFAELCYGVAYSQKKKENEAAKTQRESALLVLGSLCYLP